MDKIQGIQYEFEGISSKNKIKSAIESLLFVSGNPLTIRDFCNALDLPIKDIKIFWKKFKEIMKRKKEG